MVNWILPVVAVGVAVAVPQTMELVDHLVDIPGGPYYMLVVVSVDQHLHLVDTHLVMDVPTLVVAEVEVMETLTTTTTWIYGWFWYCSYCLSILTKYLKVDKMSQLFVDNIKNRTGGMLVSQLEWLSLAFATFNNQGLYRRDTEL